jgi:hypothetical protein
VTETPPARADGKRGERNSHRPIPPLPNLGPERLRAWVRSQSDAGVQPRAEQRPAFSSRASLERDAVDVRDAEHDIDDDRPTRRPPSAAELAKGGLEHARHDVEARDVEPSSDEAWSGRAKPVSIEPEALIEEPDPQDAGPESADEDELDTLPPTPAEEDGDDEPTIVEPFAYFAREHGSTDRTSDDRPTDRSMRAAAPVAVDAVPSPAAIPARRASEPRRAEPPPAARVNVARDIGPAPIAFPGSAAPAVRVMSAEAASLPPSAPSLAGPASTSATATPPQGFAPAMTGRAEPSAVPAAPVFASQMFRASQKPPPRSNFTTYAAAIAALVVVVAAGYLGAVSGKATTTTPDPIPFQESAIAKIDPPPPVAAVTPHEPPPAPPPSVEAPPPSRARAVPDEPPPPPRDTVREPPTRRTPSDEEPSRARTASETPRPARNRAPRPPADEENSGDTAPETRLPDSNDAPAARPSIDQGALRSAFAEGEAKAKACLGSTSPTGTARFSVTFAPTGEAVGAIVSGAPFANTLEGQCMAAKFRTLHVPPFTGPEVIVRKSIKFL